MEGFVMFTVIAIVVFAVGFMVGIKFNEWVHRVRGDFRSGYNK